jgi:hypothetical protein
VLSGQPIGRKLGPDETRAMIEFACRRPKANADSIVYDSRIVLGLNPPQSTALVRLPCRPPISAKLIQAV